MFNRCEKCGKRAFIVKKRTYKIPNVGIATSQRRLCGACFRGIKNINKNILSKKD